MANKKHVEILRSDVKKWNKWRAKNIEITPDLEGANLTRAYLTDANLTWANLTWADLTRANLPGADLTKANLTEANLTKANLAGANLTGANLTRAYLTDANLTWADLTRADLIKADTKGAIFDFASWPLWCGSFGVKADDRLVSQHFRNLIKLDDSGCSEEVQAEMKILRGMKLANKFSEYRDDVGPYEPKEAGETGGEDVG